MHELLLFGQVSALRHNQVLNVLAGVAAMQPVPIVEKHLIFKPDKGPGLEKSVQASGAQEPKKNQVQVLQAQTHGELFYMQLVAEYTQTTSGGKGHEGAEADVDMDREEAFESHDTSQANAMDKETAMSTQKWTLQFRDIPEVSRQRPVTSRLISDVPILSGDALKFMSALDYTQTSSYLLKGHRFTHGSINIQLYRLFARSDSPLQSQSSGMSEPTITKSQSWHLLDPSGAYIVQAAMRVQDGSKVETMTKGVNELLSLKEMLNGVVEMVMGDRLALDTRVR